MAEGKYGRLFTEEDMLDAIQGAYELGLQAGEEGQPYTGVEFPGLLDVLAHRRHAFVFPADEPLFLLRGQDKVAALAILDYCQRVRVARGSGRHGTDSFAAAVMEAAEVMRDWQAAHPDRVKVPD